MCIFFGDLAQLKRIFFYICRVKIKNSSMIIARDKELKILRDLQESKYSNLVAIYGRRRVGKTFLIREAYNYNFCFEHSGLNKGTLNQQLQAFKISLNQFGAKIKKNPKNWLEAFECLMNLINSSKTEKKVIFLDEVSWMATRNSDFMQALEFFWNSWASARKDIILVLCASATSWLIKKIVHNKGGLYNRLNVQILVEPFNLSQAKEFVNAFNINLSLKQIAEYYMVAGGVPFYWSLLEKQYSLSQNIDNIFFNPNAKLKNEYEYLFSSLFDNPLPYLKIIESLATKKIGMTREEILKNTSISNNGTFSSQLKDLEYCGFIRKYNSFGKKTKDTIYQLIDNFILFHFGFLKDNLNEKNFWQTSYNSPKLNTWRGLAFENICLNHISQIKNALGILGINSSEYSFKSKENNEKGIYGSQIDLIIDRKDDTINLCEIKFSNMPFVVEKDYHNVLLTKLNDFEKETNHKKTILLTLISANGLKQNIHSDIINNVITLEDFFK